MDKSKEFRKEIADKFIAGLKEDGLDWKQGWNTDSIMPVNSDIGRKYRGMNRFNLAFVAMAKGYEDNRWYTFNQIRAGGFHLTRGSKGEKVEYWYPYDTKEKKALTWDKYKELIAEGREQKDFILKSRFYTVFNGDQIEGIPERKIYVNEDVEPDRIITALSVSMNVPITLSRDGSAYYSLVKDTVYLPEHTSFHSTEEYNATALHELAHSTGHMSRLGRDQSGCFGTKEYAYEELVAEITSVFMSVHTGINAASMNMDNHKAYVNSWIEILEKSPEILGNAIKDADAATDYMENHVFDLIHGKDEERQIEQKEEFDM